MIHTYVSVLDSPFPAYPFMRTPVLSGLRVGGQLTALPQYPRPMRDECLASLEAYYTNNRFLISVHVTQRQSACPPYTTTESLAA